MTTHKTNSKTNGSAAHRATNRITIALALSALAGAALAQTNTSQPGRPIDSINMTDLSELAANRPALPPALQQLLPEPPPEQAPIPLVAPAQATGLRKTTAANQGAGQQGSLQMPALPSAQGMSTRGCRGVAQSKEQARSQAQTGQVLCAAE